MSEFQLNNPTSVEIQGTDSRALPGNIQIDGTGTLPGGAPTVYSSPESIQNSGLQLQTQNYQLELDWVDRNGNVIATSTARGTASAQEALNMAANGTNINRESIEVPSGVLPNGQTRANVVNTNDLLQYEINGVPVAYTIRSSVMLDANGNPVGQPQPGATGIDGTRNIDYLPSNNGIADPANAIERGDGTGLNIGNTPIINSTALTSITLADGTVLPVITNGGQLHTQEVGSNGVATSINPSDAEGLVTVQRDSNSQIVTNTTQNVTETPGRIQITDYTVTEVGQRTYTQLSQETATSVEQNETRRIEEQNVSRTDRVSSTETADIQSPDRFIPDNVAPSRTQPGSLEIQDAGGLMVNQNGQIILGGVTSLNGNDERVLTGQDSQVDVYGNIMVNPDAIVRATSGDTQLGDVFATIGAGTRIATPTLQRNQETGLTEPTDVRFGLNLFGGIGVGEVAQTTTATIQQNGVASTEIIDTETITTNTTTTYGQQMQQGVTVETDFRQTDTYAPGQRIETTTSQQQVDTTSMSFNGQVYQSSSNITDLGSTTSVEQLESNQIVDSQTVQTGQRTTFGDATPVGDRTIVDQQSTSSSQVTSQRGDTTVNWEQPQVTDVDTQLHTGAFLFGNAALSLDNEHRLARNPLTGERYTDLAFSADLIGGRVTQVLGYDAEAQAAAYSSARVTAAIGENGRASIGIDHDWTNNDTRVTGNIQTNNLDLTPEQIARFNSVTPGRLNDAVTDFRNSMQNNNIVFSTVQIPALDAITAPATPAPAPSTEVSAPTR